MRISNFNQYVKALIEVEVEGYFVERFINLCMINNIKIWDIVHVSTGKITFKMASKEFKKIKPYIRISKCKANIKSKKGIYFDLFRYRKRRLIIYLTVFVLLLFALFSNIIWKIDIVGNERINTETISQLISKKGVKPGNVKFLLSKGQLADYIRANLYEVAWVGVDIEGTTLVINIKEKIMSTEEDKTMPGNIVANKSAIITKIIADNGTALYKTGSYINKGDVAIEGVIKSKLIDPIYVHASGIVRGIIEYKFERAYVYKEKVKEYTGKSRHGIGIKINNKKIVIKHLPKDFKYDITNTVKNVRVFGVNISFILSTYEEYIEKDIVNTKDVLVQKGEKDYITFLNDILVKGNKVENKQVEIIESNEGITYIVTVKVDENIGEFVKTGDK